LFAAGVVPVALACGDSFDGEAATRHYEADLAAAVGTRVKIEYRMTTDPIDANDSPPIYQVILYQSGSSTQHRVDIFAEDGASIVYLTRGEQSITCSNDGEVIVEGHEGGACTAGELADGTFAFFLIPPFALQPLSEQRERTIKSTNGGKIAGELVQCYHSLDIVERPLGTPLLLPSSICITKSGHVLSETISDGTRSYRWNATAVGDVTDDDFEPPYPIVDQS
jgi:hypothetical protein